MEIDPSKTSGPTMVVLAGVTVFMLILGVKWSTAQAPDLTSGGSSACVFTQVRQGDTVTPADVLVSVYNAGSKAGTASKAMGQLEKRGFAPGSTGNTTVAEVRKAEVWGDPLNPAAQLVAEQLDATVVDGQPLLGEGVVVVVGDRYRKLDKRVEDIVADTDATICSPSY